MTLCVIAIHVQVHTTANALAVHKVVATVVSVPLRERTVLSDVQAPVARVAHAKIANF
jgi:hypothetical protein